VLFGVSVLVSVLVLVSLLELVDSEELPLVLLELLEPPELALLEP
jgi:hypothetical protein